MLQSGEKPSYFWVSVSFAFGCPFIPSGSPSVALQQTFNQVKYFLQATKGIQHRSFLPFHLQIKQTIYWNNLCSHKLRLYEVIHLRLWWNVFADCTGGVAGRIFSIMGVLNGTCRSETWRCCAGLFWSTVFAIIKETTKLKASSGIWLHPLKMDIIKHCKTTQVINGFVHTLLTFFASIH